MDLSIKISECLSVLAGTYPSKQYPRVIFEVSQDGEGTWIAEVEFYGWNEEINARSLQRLGVYASPEADFPSPVWGAGSTPERAVETLRQTLERNLDGIRGLYGS